MHPTLTAPIGAPPQSSLRPGYRNRGPACRGCRTWYSSHTPSKGNVEDGGRLTSWHPLTSRISLGTRCFRWRHLHERTYYKNQTIDFLLQLDCCTTSKILRNCHLPILKDIPKFNPKIPRITRKSTIKMSRPLPAPVPQPCRPPALWFPDPTTSGGTSQNLRCTRSMIVPGVSATRSSQPKSQVQGAHFKIFKWSFGRRPLMVGGETKLPVKNIPGAPATQLVAVDPRIARILGTWDAVRPFEVLRVLIFLRILFEAPWPILSSYLLGWAVSPSSVEIH